MPYFTSNGANLHVHTAGKGPVLLALHELTLDHRQWTPQLESWGGEHRIDGLDLRGHGRSDRAASGYGWKGAAADVQRAAVQLGMSRVEPGAVVAQGESCDAALQLALADPRAVKALVLVTPVLWGLEVAPEWESLLAAMRAHVEAGSMAAAMELFRADPAFAGVRGDPELLRSVVEMQSKCTGAVLRRDEEPTGTATAARLADCKVPILAVCGANDREGFRAAAAAIASACPRAHVVTCDGVAHFPNLESPDSFAALVGDFLRENA